MTMKEYLQLFHRAKVNLVAFKPIFHCDEELRNMVEMAVEEEREACARTIDDLVLEHPGRADLTAQQCAQAIRARGET
jgi:hypothetical protein